MFEKLTSATFARHLNTRFRVQNGAASAVAVELIEVNEGRSSPQYEVFSVLFRGPPDTFLPQGMYRIDHDELGASDLFIVPIRRDERGFYYEAAFNCLRGEEQQ